MAIAGEKVGRPGTLRLEDAAVRSGMTLDGDREIRNLERWEEERAATEGDRAGRQETPRQADAAVRSEMTPGGGYRNGKGRASGNSAIRSSGTIGNDA